MSYRRKKYQNVEDYLGISGLKIEKDMKGERVAIGCTIFLPII